MQIAGLTHINDDVYLRSEDVVSVEREIINEYTSPSPSDVRLVETFNGSRVTLKNGRKVFVRGMVPKEILEKFTDTPGL